MPRSRAAAWLRDELILALDLYVREGVNASGADRQELSELLRAIPVEPDLAADPSFRSRAAVSYRLGNFESVNPDSTAAGFEHAGEPVERVWDEFAGEPDRLAKTAAAIRANLDALAPTDAESEDPAVTEAEEGTILTQIHRLRERSAKLVAAKKASAATLACEACGFDFEGAYGPHGAGFIECHHLKPLHTLRKGQRTQLSDLALVCSNCHRMIHRRKQWLTMDDLAALLGEPG